MLKRIAVADLRIGMYIQEFCGSWMDHPFWKSKFMLSSEKDLARIHSSAITELWIDVGKGADVAPGVQATTEEEAECEAEARLLAAIEPPKVKALSMEQELEQAVKLCARSRQAVMEMFNDARMGQALQFEQAAALVEEISESVLRHPNALISLARLKHSNEYTYMHSVAVCALMIALARKLGLPDDAVREAGLAGLLHDIGKMAVPQELLDKPGKLTDTEFAKVRKHPEEGGSILLASKQVSALVLDVCLHHHEKVDGSGYPHRLQGDQISLMAKMGAVCDVYDAITSNRPYKQGWGPGRVDPQDGRVEGALRRGRVPGLRQNGWHLPGRRAGAPAERASGGGHGAESQGAAGAQGQGVLLDQVALAAAAKHRRPEQDYRPGPYRRARVGRRVGVRAARRVVEWDGSGGARPLRLCCKSHLSSLPLWREPRCFAGFGYPLRGHDDFFSVSLTACG